ncbi:hypothetical protein E4U21_004776 [Claviceps maximensis]|nr:hypothetical protein E4U21_004776 [Claviceps maximensis]
MVVDSGLGRAPGGGSAASVLTRAAEDPLPALELAAAAAAAAAVKEAVPEPASASAACGQQIEAAPGQGAAARRAALPSAGGRRSGRGSGSALGDDDVPSRPPSNHNSNLNLDLDLDLDHSQDQPVKLTRDKRGQWSLAPDGQLANNLSWVVGFMELANAGDFAANVWNDVPIPVYAVVLMAIGGTVAGVMSVFAFRDARRACHNVRYLRKHRSVLLEEKRERERRATPAATLDLDVILAINFRELGTELVSRWIMDLLMGFGAILICIGTYLAIGGATPAVYLASNLLSGYVGNTPIALFGLVNSSWAVYILCKAQSHVAASRRLLGPCTTAAALVKRRARKVQVFSVINGTATILGGVASVITATRWWGYVVLVPVILSSIFCNVWWRTMIGYSRSEGHPPIRRDDLVHALELAAAAEFSPPHDAEAASPQWCPDLPDSLADVLALLSRHSLFPRFCLAVVAAHSELCQALALVPDGDHDVDHNHTDAGHHLTLTPADFCALPAIWHPALLDTARTVVKDVRPSHFKNRQRYLAELLGTYCTMVRQKSMHNESDDAASHPSQADVTEKS